MDTILATIVKQIREAERENFIRFSPEHFVLAEREKPLELKPFIDREFFVVAEVKKGSPSRGLIRPDLDPAGLAREYEAGGASAVSVITESRHFFGRKEFLTRVKESVGLPVLRKDFLVHPFQVYESYNLGADFILLMAACLTDGELAKMREAARALGLGVLLEIHDREEWTRTSSLKPDLVGINNRDLKDFSVDWRRSLELRPHVPPDIPVISESGIRSPEQVRVLKEAGFAGILVGEYLIRSSDPGRTLRELIDGKD
jgi:indole-3-glycerol phosphate synthase